MSGRDYISRNKNRQRELNNAVRNYNRRLDRIKEANPELIPYLPEKAFVSDLRKDIGNIKDLRREINKLNRMTKETATDIKTSEYGEKASQYDIKEATIRTAVLNRKKREQLNKINEIPASSRGQPLGMTRGEMGSSEVTQYRPTKFNFNKMKPGEFEKHVRKVEKMSNPTYFDKRDEALRENYIIGVKENFGETSETKDLIEYIKNMDIKDFKNAFYGDQEATIGFLYDPISAQYKLEVIKHIFMGNAMSEDVTAAKERNEKFYKKAEEEHKAKPSKKKSKARYHDRNRASYEEHNEKFNNKTAGEVFRENSATSVNIKRDNTNYDDLLNLNLPKGTKKK